MTTKLEFLQAHPIFANLDDGDLLELSRIAREYTFEEDAIIAYQRDLADSMILVVDGRMYAREVDQQGLVREENTRAFEKDGYFGDTSLFRPEQHFATVEATHAGRYIEIEGNSFRAFLVNNPRVLKGLEPVLNDELEREGGLPEPAWELAKQLLVEGSNSPDDQATGERLIFQTRQSELYLLSKIVLPGFIFVIAAMLLVAGVVQVIWLEPRILWVMIAMLALLATSLKISYEIYDWYKDIFKVTNLHITLDEFEFRTFTTLMMKVPIIQVQTVSILKPSIIANFLKLGGIGITTASSVGEIKFDYIRNPGQVMQVIARAVEEAQSAEVAATQSVMRAAVSNYFDLESGMKPVDPEDEIVDAVPTTRKRRFWPFRFRIVDGNTITYHRNIFVLLASLIKPGLMTVALAVGLAIAGSLFGWDNWMIYAGFIVVFLINIIWYVYEIIDWNNDIFMVTDQIVIDEDRSPFLSRVSRKQAPLTNVQNVRVNKEGILAAIFNFGDVYIETAGATSDIVFENIHNPGQALYDIFFRLDKLRESDRRGGGELRRQEYTVLLDVYQQELERDRIPNRLPEIDD